MLFDLNIILQTRTASYHRLGLRAFENVTNFRRIKIAVNSARDAPRHQPEPSHWSFAMKMFRKTHGGRMLMR